MSDRQERLNALRAALACSADMLHQLEQELPRCSPERLRVRSAASAAEDASSFAAMAEKALLETELAALYPDATCLEHEGPVYECQCEVQR